MKVYLVIDIDYCGRHTDSVYGVFSSEDKAKEFIVHCAWLKDDEKDFLVISEQELDYA